jgi:hypothetical protein
VAQSGGVHGGHQGDEDQQDGDGLEGDLEAEQQSRMAHLERPQACCSCAAIGQWNHQPDQQQQARCGSQALHEGAQRQRCHPGQENAGPQGCGQGPGIVEDGCGKRKQGCRHHPEGRIGAVDGGVAGCERLLDHALCRPLRKLT